MKINVKLLRKVQKHILEEPARFVMRSWRITKKQEEDDGFYPDYHMDADGHWTLSERTPFARCNTAACIGGWACILSGMKITARTDIGKSAAKLLGLEDEDQMDRLFTVPQWPARLRKQYSVATTQAARVKIAAKRIDHFIATKGAD